VRDRLSSRGFCGRIEDGIPDGTTLGYFGRRLRGRSESRNCSSVLQPFEAKGYIARGGQMVDATIVPVPKQRNSRERK